MKAFVIKNKEGKYYSRNLLNPDNFLFENRIVDCELFATEEIAKFEITFNELKDCEPVEITMAEGDLEQQLKEKDEEIKELKEHIKFLENKCLNEINVKLVNVTKEKEKEIRKRVYDEIRKSFDEHRKILHSNYDECIFSMDNIIEELEELKETKEGIK